MGKCKSCREGHRAYCPHNHTPRPTDAEVVTRFWGIADDNSVRSITMEYEPRTHELWRWEYTIKFDDGYSLSDVSRTQAGACRKALRAYRKQVGK
jgi:hypothetical protein